MEEGTFVTFVKPPSPVGYWNINPGVHGYSTHIPIYKRPTDQQIKNTEELLGWEFKEIKQDA